MQFLATTWRARRDPRLLSSPGSPTTNDSQGYASDADGDGLADIWNINDAALAAARLCKRTAPRRLPAGHLRLQPFLAYVTRVLRIAESYRAESMGKTEPDGSPGAWASRISAPRMSGAATTPPRAANSGSAQPTPAVAREVASGSLTAPVSISWAYAKARHLWIGGTTGEQWQIAGETPGATRDYGAPPEGWQAGDIGFYDFAQPRRPRPQLDDLHRGAQTGADVRVGLFSTRGQPYGYARYPHRPLHRGTS